MATITVLAGDFLQGDGEFHNGTLTLRTPLHPWPGTSIPTNALATLEVANEESINKVKDAIGFGIAGAMILGPIGAIAGFLLAGKETEVTFIATLKDGRKLLAAVDSDTYQEISNRFHKQR
jgi:hypothetical protein